MLLNKEEKIAYLQQTFQAALGAGLCRTSKGFAELLDIDKSGLSSAFNGSDRYLTDSLIKKVSKWAEAHGFATSDGETPAKEVRSTQQQEGGVWIPDKTLELYNNLSETCKNLSALLAKMRQ